MDVYEAIYSRRIVRDIKEQPVKDEIIEKIISAGLYAPTHDHLRNWEFGVLKDKKIKKMRFNLSKTELNHSLRY